MKTSIAGIILVSALFLFSCGSGNSKKAPIDTPTSGTISIAVDEAFMPFMQSEITAFQGTYTKAKILAYYVSEKHAFELLMKDSVRLVVSNRSFSEAELAELKKQTITPKFLKIATDALGVVLNNSNPDTLLTTDHLRQILTTENWVWKNLSGKGISKPVELVLDKEGTSNYASVLSKLNLKPEEIRCKITFAGGDREVINYVNQHPA
ncbi:MAG TPA: substrate-binding domain-containing protein, partial [Catalimonadaceae bacterium]|nr:substrate-binding domain-containing protein [Catalimonadaceae bacterium]